MASFCAIVPIRCMLIVSVSIFSVAWLCRCCNIYNEIKLLERKREKIHGILPIKRTCRTYKNLSISCDSNQKFCSCNLHPGVIYHIVNLSWEGDDILLTTMSKGEVLVDHEARIKLAETVEYIGVCLENHYDFVYLILIVLKTLKISGSIFRSVFSWIAATMYSIIGLVHMVST